MADLRTRLASLAANGGRWLLRRGKERSTWAGVALALTSLGYEAQGREVDRLAEVLMTLGIITGTGLAAATTTPHLPPAPDPQS